MLKTRSRGRPRKVSQPEKNRPLRFFYEEDNGKYRWWRNDMPGDVFDIIDKEELNSRIKGAQYLQILVIDHLPGFCDLGIECPDHYGYY